MKSLILILSMLSATAFADTGTIKLYNETRGFGFLTPHDGRVDYFFYTVNIVAEDREVLQHGCVVEFDQSAEDPRQADNIRIVSCPAE